MRRGAARARRGAGRARRGARGGGARGGSRRLRHAASPGSGRPRSSRGSCASSSPGARVLLGTCDDLSIPRPLGPIRDLAGSVSPPLDEALSRGAAVARDPGPARSPSSSCRRGRRCSCSRTCTGPTTRRSTRSPCSGAGSASLPALLVLTFRGGEVPPAHPLRAAVGAIRADDSVFLELAPLSERAVASLAGDDAGEVYAATGGQPVLRHRAARVARPTAELPPSVANAVLGRASRLDDDARRLVELVSVVPSRVSTSVLDAVMPGWPAAAEEPERRQLLEVEPAYVRFRHELARNAIRSSVPAAARRRLHAEILDALLAADADPADIVHHAEAAGAEDVVADYALVAARRAAALESNREAYSHYRRAADFVDRLPAAEQAAVLEELATRRVRRRPARRRVPRDRARDRGLRASSATRRPSAAARGSSRGCTGTPATARSPGRRRSRRSRSSSRSASRSSSPAPTAASRSSRCSRRTSSRRSTGASGRSSSRAGSATSASRAHALVNLGTRARPARPRRRTARSSRRTRSRDAAGDREEAARALANLGFTLMCWVQPEPALALRASRRSRTPRSTRCTSSSRTPRRCSRGCACGRASGTRPSASRARELERGTHRPPAAREDRADRARRPPRRPRRRRAAGRPRRRRPTARASLQRIAPVLELDDRVRRSRAAGRCRPSGSRGSSPRSGRRAARPAGARCASPRGRPSPGSSVELDDRVVRPVRGDARAATGAARPTRSARSAGPTTAR